MRFALYILLLLIVRVSLTAQFIPGYPYTRKDSVTNQYFDVSVVDNYRWLEKTGNQEVNDWVENQNNYTVSYFDSIPFFEKLKKNVKSKLPVYLDFAIPNQEIYFKMMSAGERSGRKDFEEETPSLFYRRKTDDNWTELINPKNYKKTKSENVVITGYVASVDNRFLAFSISRNGSDWNEIFIRDLRTGKDIDKPILWVKHNQITWLKDGFFYSKYDKPPIGEELLALNRNPVLCYHKLFSENDSEVPVSFCDRVQVIDSSYLFFYTREYINNNLMTIISKCDLRKENWLNKKPQKFFMYPARYRYQIDIVDVINDSAIIRNNILAGKGMLAKFYLNGLNVFSVMIPEYKEILVNTFFYAGKFHCLYKGEEAYIMVRFDKYGKREKVFQFGRFMHIYDFEFYSKNEFCYSETSFDRPRVIYKFDLKNYRSQMVNYTFVKYEVNDFVTRQIKYMSNDSVPIAITVFHKKGLKIDENTPLLLTAYGGFGFINEPYYDYANILWAENGGVIAMAHVRGGGENGILWHIAGRKENKLTTINDFIAAAKFLIKEKYTNPGKLAITGGSHGGMLVAAVINRNPELFCAAIPVVGVYDMFRYQHFTSAKGTIDEFGTSDIKEEFEVLKQYSPYHNITHKNYPAVLVLTSKNDDRVPPFHSYKYIAQLQNKTPENPVKLLYVENSAGHSGALNMKDEVTEKALILSFLFDVMKIDPKFNF